MHVREKLDLSRFCQVVRFSDVADQAIFRHPLALRLEGRQQLVADLLGVKVSRRNAVDSNAVLANTAAKRLIGIYVGRFLTK